MSQNTPNVRTRREQLSTYPESVCVGRYSGHTWQLELDGDDLDADRLVEGPVLYVRCDIAHRSQKETAERGAVHQWRLTPDDEWVNAVDLVEVEQVRNGYPNSETRTLYARPANVAALEARIASLTEAEQLARADAEASKAREDALQKALRHVTWTASEYGLGKIGHESAVNRARAALTREGGV